MYHSCVYSQCQLMKVHGPKCSELYEYLLREANKLILILNVAMSLYNFLYLLEFCSTHRGLQNGFQCMLPEEVSILSSSENRVVAAWCLGGSKLLRSSVRILCLSCEDQGEMNTA